MLTLLPRSPRALPTQGTNHNDRPMVRRNFNLGVVNGSLWMFGRALTEPETVLPAFAVALMGDNPIYVGLLVSVVNAGWFWPPLVVAPALATRQRRHIFYQISSVFRVVAIVSVFLAIKYLAREHAATAFWVIMGCYLVYTSGGGVGLVPFMSVVTDSVPANRRGAFFGLRYLIGGLLAFGGGFWVKWVLSAESGMTFPDNYALVFMVAAIISSVSLGVFCWAVEPSHKVETRRFRMGVQLVRGLRRAARERDFRLLLGARMCYSAACGLVFPFLVPYAYRYLDMTEAMVGILVAVRQLCYSTSNVLWSRISDRRGNVPLFIISGAITLVSVGLAIAAPFLPNTVLGTIWGLDFDLRLVALVLAFAASGAGNSGQVVAHNSYLLEFTPERTRPVYMATYFLILLPLAFMPLATALLIGKGGHYMGVFIAGAVVFVAMMGLEAMLHPLRGPRANGRQITTS